MQDDNLTVLSGLSWIGIAFVVVCALVVLALIVFIVGWVVTTYRKPDLRWLTNGMVMCGASKDPQKQAKCRYYSGFGGGHRCGYLRPAETPQGTCGYTSPRPKRRKRRDV